MTERPSPVDPLRLRAVRRAGALLAGVTLVVLTSSGCAMAMRAVTVAGATTTIADLVDSAQDASATQLDTADLTATVDGTGGSGLRLNRHPGRDRVSVLPDGTDVTVRCRATGRHVDGPHGSTTDWGLVVTADGSEGYLSFAYLVVDGDPDGLDPC